MTDLLVVNGFAVTSHMVEAYDGVRIPRAEIERIGEQMRLRVGRSLRVAHDGARGAMGTILDVQLRELVDGELGVWIEFEVDRADWEAGGFRGLSVSVAEPLSEYRSDGPAMRVAADAAHFTDEQIDQAARTLASRFSVTTARLYQFALVPPPTVVIELAWVTLQAVPANLLASALWDAIKKGLLRPKHGGQAQLELQFHRTPDGSSDIHAFVTGSDETVRRALDRLAELALAAERAPSAELSLTYDQTHDVWNEISRDREASQ